MTRSAFVTPSASNGVWDVERIRKDFPALHQQVHGKPLVYLDSANTSQKPESVIRAMDDYYRRANANIHRATHLLSERATQLYEGARVKSARFINAPDHRSIVLTTGTTDGITVTPKTLPLAADLGPGGLWHIAADGAWGRLSGANVEGVAVSADGGVVVADLATVVLDGSGSPRARRACW